MTALELSYYIGERYRSDVNGSKAVASDGISATARSLSNQRLVIDRGSIPLDEVLFRKR